MIQNLQQLSKPLCKALLQADNEEAMYHFLRDLLTEKEIMEFTQRREIACLLAQKVSYDDIVAKTGASTTTISRVSKFLQGEWGGYRKILAKNV